MLFQFGAEAAQRNVIEASLIGLAVLACDVERDQQAHAEFDAVGVAALAVIQALRKFDTVVGDAGLATDFLHGAGEAHVDTAQSDDGGEFTLRGEQLMAFRGREFVQQQVALFRPDVEQGAVVFGGPAGQRYLDEGCGCL